MVLTPEESSRLDRESPEPVETLMERAGLGVALAAVRQGAGYGRRVVVLAGPGNNGGDGYVAARHLIRRGVAVEVNALTEPRTEACGWAARGARLAGVPVRSLGAPTDCDLVVDALFGGGFRSGLPDDIPAWMDHPAKVVAVDVPTGLDPATGEVAERAFEADETVTFHSLKIGHVLGHGPDVCGRVSVVDIGLTGGRAALRLVDLADALRPPRFRLAHKWSAGSVLVVGGSPGMAGAAVLAGRTALRFGAGSVAIAAPAVQRNVVAGLAPELLTYRFDDLDRVADRFDVTVLGPGLGRDHADLVERLVQSRSAGLLLDADALNTTTVDALARRVGPTVLTPHTGEFRRLFGEPGLDGVVDAARRSGCVTLLKGNPTLVAHGDDVWAIDAGGPELATIGTGDVLAGMLAALWARGLDPFTAARSAAYWHGTVGSMLARTATVTADRMADAVGAFAWDGMG